MWFLQPYGTASECLMIGRGLGPGRGGDNPTAAGHGGLDELRTFGAAQLPAGYSHRTPLWVIVT
jgi:hypothetical protein